MVADYAAKTVLVVEDDYLLAAELVQHLEAAGATVLGPVPTLTGARALLGAVPLPHLAILDIRLGDDLVFPLADHLRQSAVPLIFVTGYDAGRLPAAYADIPHFAKPVDFS